MAGGILRVTLGKYLDMMALGFRDLTTRDKTTYHVLAYYKKTAAKSRVIHSEREASWIGALLRLVGMIVVEFLMGRRLQIYFISL